MGTFSITDGFSDSFSLIKGFVVGLRVRLVPLTRFAVVSVAIASFRHPLGGRGGWNSHLVDEHGPLGALHGAISRESVSSLWSLELTF